MTSSIEVWLAVGYAAFLVLSSIGLEWLSRRTAEGRGRLGFRSPREGKEARSPEASWPQSDAARFERGLSLVLRVLALFLLAVVVARYGFAWPASMGVLCVAALIVKQSGRFKSGWLFVVSRARRPKAGPLPREGRAPRA